MTMDGLALAAFIILLCVMFYFPPRLWNDEAAN